MPKPADAEAGGPEIVLDIPRLVEIEDVQLFAATMETAFAPEEDAAPIEGPRRSIFTRLRVDRPVRVLEEPRTHAAGGAAPGAGEVEEEEAAGAKCSMNAFEKRAEGCPISPGVERIAEHFADRG